MMKIFNHLKNEKGSSSILVIILMVVLMVFGLAVLTTSLSNMRLSQKKHAWLNDYYLTEAKAETSIATIDHLLLSTEAEALAYITEELYMDDYMIDMPLMGDEKTRMLGLIYHDMMIEALLEHIDGDSSASLIVNDYDVDAIISGIDVIKSELTYDISLEGEAYPKHITITLEFLSHSPDTTTDNQLTTRYNIANYFEWQEPFEYEEGVEFDDPFEEDSNNITDNPFEDETSTDDNPFAELD